MKRSPRRRSEFGNQVKRKGATVWSARAKYQWVIVGATALLVAAVFAGSAWKTQYQSERIAVAMTGGDVMLENARAELLQAGLDVLVRTGLEYNETNRGLRVETYTPSR